MCLLLLVVSVNRSAFAVTFLPSWEHTQIHQGIVFATQFNAMIFDPTTPSTLYKADGNFVEVSHDYGVTWRSTTLNAPFHNSIDVLVMDTSSPRRIYAGTHDLTPSVGDFGSGIYVSDDLGSSWQQTNEGLGDQAVTALVIDPATPEVVYAGVHTGRSPIIKGVYKSINGGKDWSVSATGLPSDAYIRALTVSPLDHSIVYAVNRSSDATHEDVYRSIDGGATWNLFTQDLPVQGTEVIAFDKQNPNDLYIGGTQGVVLSNDGGMHWSVSESSKALGVVYDFAFDSSDPTKLYAAGTGGVFISKDRGNTWAPVARQIYLPVIVQK